MEKLVVLALLAGVAVVVMKLRADAASSRKEVIARLAAEREERGGLDYSPTAELFREVGVHHDPAAPLPRLMPDVPPPPSDLDDPFDLAPTPAAVATDAVPADASGLADLELPPAPELAPEPAAELAVEPAVELAAAAEPEPLDPPSPQRRASDRPGSAPLGDLRLLFRGIAMPAGLRPLGDLTPEQATFVTAAPATSVREGLDAELHRLGAAYRWVEPTVAEATRNGQRGLLTIYPHPSAVVDLDGSPRFGDVAPGQVVVHLRSL